MRATKGAPFRCALCPAGSRAAWDTPFLQGSFMKEVGQVVLKEWGASSGIQEKNVFFYVNKVG